jgi:hypothetical protein
MIGIAYDPADRDWEAAISASPSPGPFSHLCMEQMVLASDFHSR